MISRFNKSNGVLAIAKMMIRNSDPIVRVWGNKVEAAYWAEQQLPLFTEPDGDDSEGGEPDVSD